jgi:D-glycero-alpha-D-manno-heptose 1-phosphate guanylyltransferase
MEAIVLAGGLGTRLAARLDGVPKPMAPVAGRPFLEILLTQLQRSGCARVVLSVGHLHAVIENHFGAEFRDVRIDYAIERAPLGTGGALRVALPAMTEKSVLVLNGDTFLDADYPAMLLFHEIARAAGRNFGPGANTIGSAEPLGPEVGPSYFAGSGTPPAEPSSNPSITIAVAHCADTARYGGVVIENGRITGFQEKGRSGLGWINAGAYVIDKDIEWPAHLPDKFSFETDFLAQEVAHVTPAAFKVSGFFLDIGVPEDLDRAQTELAKFFS